jgi:integrase
MDNQSLLENYAKRLGSRGKTRNLYLHYAQDFLDYADGKFDRETIDNYLGGRLQRKHKCSDGTINLVFRIIRTLFNRNNIEWPFNRGEAPQIRESKVQAPALHPNTVSKMIGAVRERGDIVMKVFLALSTVYGLRREEMVNLTQDDINLKGKTIHIATLKHGRERTHVIPEEILPYLKEYNFDEEITDYDIFVLWYQLEHLIGMRHTDHVGWHSIRRTLNTMLLRVLPEATVYGFLRWKQRTSSHMPFRYSAVKFVGEEGETTEVIGEALDVDTEVFKVHPFLKFWR